MTISNIQATALILTSGFVEDIEKLAVEEKNPALQRLAKSMKYVRNSLYVGVVLTAFATLGASTMYEGGQVGQYTCRTIALLGLGGTVLALKKMYDLTCLFKQHFPF